jgi:tetratricopeptide (TPR) repeat protein
MLVEKQRDDGLRRGLLAAVGVGCAAGVVLALLVVLAAFGVRTYLVSAYPPSSTPRPPTATPLPPTAEPSATPGFEQVALEAAERALEIGQPDIALSYVEPLEDSVRDPALLARVNDVIGGAEFMLGNSRRAAAYYERAYALEPTAERLFYMAMCSEVGGDLERALGYYLQLQGWEGAEAEPFRAAAQNRIGEIVEVIGTPTPRQ